jgi:predicted RNA-binding Zn-ribbon protein involved in translation (DUF1610 family)
MSLANQLELDKAHGIGVCPKCGSTDIEQFTNFFNSFSVTVGSVTFSGFGRMGIPSTTSLTIVGFRCKKCGYQQISNPPGMS